MSDPVMEPVSSSTINMVGYDPDNQDLHVQFKSGIYKYIYHGVPPEIFVEFRNARSKGLFHSKAIKNSYKFDKLRPTPPKLG